MMTIRAPFSIRQIYAMEMNNEYPSQSQVHQDR
jgi:hypothetical protein